MDLDNRNRVNPEIKLINPSTRDPLKLSDMELISNSHSFPKVRGAYRFVEPDNYTSSFGFQWNKYAETQVDQYHYSLNQSEERFFKETGWTQEELNGKAVLEVGSGAGRFSNVILRKTKAHLYSVDYSSAVEANYRNNGPNERLHLFQASIYELPFAEYQFDFVFCLGVLQHTPDFKLSIEKLCRMVKPGGHLVIDFYEKRGWWTKIHSKYLLRPLTSRMKHEKLLKCIEGNVDWLINLYSFFNRIGLHVFTRFVPICDIENTLPKGLSKEKLREWVILDTFDMFSPSFDNPQKLTQVKEWVNDFLDIKFYGHVFLSSGKACVIRAQYGNDNPSMN